MTELDPEPWVTPDCVRFVNQLNAHAVGRFSARFAPRAQYEQEQVFYEFERERSTP